MFTVYALKDPTTDEIRYVGVTQQTLEKRLAFHLHSPSNGAVVEWLAGLQERALKPSIIPLEENIETWEKAQLRENFHIKANQGIRLLNFKGNRKYYSRRTLSVKMPRSLHDRLCAMASELGVSLDVAVAMAVTNYQAVPFEEFPQA